jgi:predicted RNase H-like HicB family nuclease
MKYAYPAIIKPLADDESGYDVYVPDLPGCRTCGDTLVESLEMAEDAVSVWLWEAEISNMEIPLPSAALAVDLPQFVSFIKADTDAYRRQMDNRAVKKTLSIPAWLNRQAEAAHINFSGVLQEALKARLSIAE